MAHSEIPYEHASSNFSKVLTNWNEKQILIRLHKLSSGYSLGDVV